MGFIRTLSGLLAEHRFRKRLLIYFEGATDFPFYEKILRGIPCKFKSAGGKENCRKLAEEILRYDRRYIVIMDGDYEIVNGLTITRHARIIYLRRHSYENYLFELKPLQKVASNLAFDDISNELKSEYLKLQEKITAKLYKLIVLDITHDRIKTDAKVFPSAEELFTKHNGRIDFRTSRISKILNKPTLSIDTKELENSKKRLSAYLKKRRLVDIIRGHFVFGLIRKLLSTVVNRKIKRRITLDNRSLILNLCSEVWSYSGEKDHQYLRKSIRAAVRTIAPAIEN